MSDWWGSGRLMRFAADNPARELLEPHPGLSTNIKALSGMIFLSLLWRVFVLFELSDPVPRREATSEAGSARENGIVLDQIEEPDSRRYDLFSTTGMELVMSTLTLGGWACEHPPNIGSSDPLPAIPLMLPSTGER